MDTIAAKVWLLLTFVLTAGDTEMSFESYPDEQECRTALAHKGGDVIPEQHLGDAVMFCVPGKYFRRTAGRAT